MKMLLFYILVSLLQINLSWSAFQLNNAAIIATPLLRSSHVSTTTTSNDAINSKAKKSNHISKRAFRNLNFWTRAGRIYSTYKLFQIKMTSQKVLGMIRGNVRNANETKLAWDHQHEINSQRMIDLCLGLRGFYLKTGQFLGSRFDFMPTQYTKKLARLHDDVPPLPGDVIKSILESELKGTIEQYFSTLNLEQPIGSASVAQVHQGIWKQTGEKVAVKVQYPNAETLMKGDLRNLRMLAEFLQRTELKFDILSSIKELQKNIHNEFDFINEAENIETMREYLKTSVPEVNLPRAIFASKRSLVMTFVKGQNLGKLDEFSHTKSIFVPIWIKQRLGRKILDVISKAWGEMIFTHQWFNSDPHPGNICLNQHSIGLLDWGQMKRISNDATYKFAKFVQAMNSRHQNSTADAFLNLGVIVGNPQDKRSIEGLAVTMLDTRVMHGFDMDPFSPNNALKYNSVKKLPTELYFLVRTVQLMRGIAYGFHLDYSLSQRWAPYAEKAIVRIEKARCVP